ncbi:MAG: squalene--hopene cyclase [Phycisphaerae bacterium]|nr:squalene--hopene cyclase [Phycisphaerae bacterium]
MKTTMEQTITHTQANLLQQRHAGGFWAGRLSSSALSTAAAVFALGSVNRRTYQNLIEGGLYWLKDNQNKDGGWGDTIKSESRLGTTLLCLSAFSVSDGSFTHNDTMARAEAWIKHRVGSLDPRAVAQAVSQAYGQDKSMSAPILMMCAMAKRLGPRDTGWQHVPSLPFERAAVPPQLFKSLRWPVLSTALPILIAVGQARFHFKKPSSPVTRRLRQACITKTLQMLKTLQPENGGFLEAASMTSFVVMSLARTGLVNHPIVTRGAYFLVDSVRDDGSWPAASNLTTSVTTLSANALTTGDMDIPDHLTVTRDWLLTQQHRRARAYNLTAPGGWAWSDLPGAVANGDDTAGVLIALHRLSPGASRSHMAAAKGIQWLVELQNKDGGIPTFGKGWTRLPLDQSCPDVTAHALGAMGCWWDSLPRRLKQRTTRAMQRAVIYLKTTQHRQGFWTPLWCGHEQTTNQTNPVYGTSRVLTHLGHVPQSFKGCMKDELGRATEWLLAVQHATGPWGADAGIHASLEESALAVDALATTLLSHDLLLFDDQTLAIQRAIEKGAAWLINATNQGTTFDPSPIGNSFVGLRYYEELYPVTFTLAALTKARLASQTLDANQDTDTIDVQELPALNHRARASAPSDAASL